MKKQSGNRKADRHSSWISPVLFIGSSLIAVIILINVLASVTGTTLFHKDQAGEAATDTDTGAMEYAENMTLNAADYLRRTWPAIQVTESNWSIIRKPSG